MKVLCVAPRFAPTNAADSHRLRLLLPYLIKQGLEVAVMAVHPIDVPGPQDPELEARLPVGLAVTRVRAWPLAGWGLNGLAQRSFVPLYSKGCELLASGNFDLVFFSTTEFLLHGLGPLWQTRFGVPFCMDFQDPWVNDYYRDNPDTPPPGGRLKHFIVDKLHRVVERSVVNRCSGFLSVSPAYLPMLERRYGPAVARQPRLVSAFPGEPEEFAARELAQQQAGSSNYKTWRYIGRGGADMSKAASAFFMAWSSAIDQGMLAADAVRFEAIGTSYAGKEGAIETILPLAQTAGVGDSVCETPKRVGYVDTLRKLHESDALVVFGSDDPHYTASKIYPYLLAGKPLLAVFHEASSVVPVIRSVGGGTCVVFGEHSTIEETAEAICRAWFEPRQFQSAVPLDRVAFEPFTARSQARDVGEWFARVLAHEA